MERIPAMPRAAREMLIDRYCPEDLQAFVRTNRDDQDCLVRLYTGRRRLPSASQSRFQRFSLRNYPLHVDQMEELGLDTHAIARTLADALTHCYWIAGVDANDVEFVLAPQKTHSEHCENSPEVPRFRSDALGGEFVIWMLDYDCCREMSQDEAGVDQAVKAFYRNDPYYPRPYAHGHAEEDRSLWQTFRSRFLESSRHILKGRTALATILIEKIEEEGRRRCERGGLEGAD